MSILVNKAKVAYFCVPKCASSALKSLVYRIENGVSYRRGDVADGRGLHQMYPALPFEEAAAARPADYLTAAVVRHPVDRILSLYFNKVGNGRLPEFAREQRLNALGLPACPSAAEFVENLDGYQTASKRILRHSRPLSFFLGRDPAWFDRIFDIQEANALGDLLKQRSGVDDALERRNVSGSSKAIDDIGRAGAMIAERFEEDLKLFGSWIAPSRWSAHLAAQ
ncbi:MAG: sulfotransferase family 2 domain-containing protein [Pseudomonadota bacterium]